MSKSNVDKHKCQKFLTVVYTNYDIKTVHLFTPDRWTIPKKVQRTCLSLKNNYSNSVYAQHLINHGHSLGQIEDIMDIIFTTHRGKQLDTDKKYHIHQTT